MVKGVIFDMDGLMFDTERMWKTFWEPELAARGLVAPPTLAEETCGTTDAMLQQTLKRYFGADFDASGFMSDYRARAWKTFFAAPVPKKEGLDALVQYLKANNIPMAIASSSPSDLVANNLAQNDMTQDFAVCITGNMVANSKPAPDIFLRAAADIGVAPAECLVLEDSYNGVRAGAAGGFITVMVPDLLPANDEMRAIYTAEYPDLHAVKQAIIDGAL